MTCTYRVPTVYTNLHINRGLLDKRAAAEGGGEGGGAVEPFYPQNSTVYQPQKSKTFSVVPKAMFLLGYANV